MNNHRQTLGRLREAHLYQHPESWQFDVIAVEVQPGENANIEHFENVIS